MDTQLNNKSSQWGILLIALGAFFLLQVTGIFGALSGLFLSLVFAAAGAIFLYVFLTAIHTRWWAAIPGFTLLGLAALLFYDRFAPPFFADIGAAILLAAIGTGFIAIFFTNRQQWWAMIPGGVLWSVAGVIAVANSGLDFLNPASVLFIGIGCTFGLLGLMSTYLDTNLRWAYIPALVMFVMGIVIFTPFVGALNWIWPLALIGGGAWLVLRRPAAEAPLDNHLAPGAPLMTDSRVQSPAEPPATATATAATVTQPTSVAEPVEPITLR